MQAHTARNFEFSCCLHPWTVHSRFLSSSAATLIGLFRYQTVSVQLHQRPACAVHKNQSVSGCWRNKWDLSAGWHYQGKKEKKVVSADTEAKATSSTSYFRQTLEPFIGHSRDRDCTEH